MMVHTIHLMTPFLSLQCPACTANTIVTELKMRIKVIRLTNINGKFATTYFRKKYEVASPGAFPSYVLRVLKDDYCRVFINDVLVFSDITNAVVNYDTYPPGAIAHDGTVYVETNVPPGVLVAT